MEISQRHQSNIPINIHFEANDVLQREMWTEQLNTRAPVLHCKASREGQKE